MGWPVGAVGDGRLLRAGRGERVETRPLVRVGAARQGVTFVDALRVQGMVRAKEELPRGYTAALGGQAEYMDEVFAEFGLLAGVMLVGVVVNAAILIIDVWRQTGDVKEAATSKFRPVLMSCVAALVGMLPMALGGGLGSELRQSMGIGSVGGILVSTLVSLYFIPALCACLKGYGKPSRMEGP